MARWAVPGVLVALAVLGLWLVVTGGDDGSAGDGDATDGAAAPERTLDIEDTDLAAVAELGGLVLPPGTEDFLAARVDNDTQLDVTFTLDPTAEAEFVASSELPPPEADNRVILHSSPLWNLNPDSDIRGTEDSVGDVRRRVEMVEEDGRTRVRLVLTPA